MKTKKKRVVWRISERELIEAVVYYGRHALTKRVLFDRSSACFVCIAHKGKDGASNAFELSINENQ